MITDADRLVQALADPARLRASVLLNGEPALCVCELMAALGVSQPKMLRHLAALRAQGIVEDGRIANRVFYRLHPRLPGWARGVIDHLGHGLIRSPDLAAARRRLEAFPNRPRQRHAFPANGPDPAREDVDHAV